jgi:demethylmenaquinone methyltransferase/2-methoxy-6-polyprenyl-1,4-benzoquinol methylase
VIISYKIISKFYGLLDLIYFRNSCKNPRYILSTKIPNDSSKILEIATGTAKNIILLGEQKPKLGIIGIDLSEEMLNIARNRITKKKINNIELIKMDGIKIAFNDKTFEYIIISLLLHELIEDIANKILRECCRVLKHDGKILVLEWEKPQKIIQKILFFITTVFEPKAFKHFMKKDLEKYFLNNGFKINSIEYGNYSKVIELIKDATSA